MKTVTAFNRVAEFASKSLLFVAMCPLLPVVGLIWLVAVSSPEEVRQTP